MTETLETFHAFLPSDRYLSREFLRQLILDSESPFGFVPFTLFSSEG